MQYEFLKHFPARMKHVGLYARLLNNNSQKLALRKYGFESDEEQINLDFSVLLFIMEQSLKEEICTIDDVAIFIDDLNVQAFKKELSREDCLDIADMIVNIVLSNNGAAIQFSGYDFEQSQYVTFPIRYIGNRIANAETDEPRTTYYLTEDGYNLLLSTLEVESNMKLTIQEMIFRMHLERQNYDKALDDIKAIFNLIRIQLLKNTDAIAQIRRNVLEYSTEDYHTLLGDNLSTIQDTQHKFEAYRETVRQRRTELEQSHMDIRSFTEEEKASLSNLREIETYLGRTIDEHLRVLGGHLSLKDAYTAELEKLQDMRLVQRFSLRTEVYEAILKNPKALERFHLFLNPLFLHPPEKVLNLNMMFEPQHTRLEDNTVTVQEEMDFDEAAWALEQERIQTEKLNRYRECLTCVLEQLNLHSPLRLSDLQLLTETDARLKARLLPNAEIFKEVFVELIRASRLTVQALRDEQSRLIQTETDFGIGRMLLSILDTHPEWSDIQTVQAVRLPDSKPVCFTDVYDAYGESRTIRCSNLKLSITRAQS